MPTIAEQLTQLASDRDDLVSNLITKGITGLTGDETFTELVPEVLNIPTGGDVSDYFATPFSGDTNASAKLHTFIKKIPAGLTCGQSMQNFFIYCTRLEEVGILNTTNTTNMNGIFGSCESLKTAPLLDMSNVTTAYNMFERCKNLENIPAYNTVKVTSLASMFGTVNFPKNLTDESLNNILGMCIKANSTYTSTKDLKSVMFGSYIPSSAATSYPASRIQALPNYQAFIDAGWTIGW